MTTWGDFVDLCFKYRLILMNTPDAAIKPAYTERNFSRVNQIFPKLRKRLTFNEYIV